MRVGGWVGGGRVESDPRDPALDSAANKINKYANGIRVIYERAVSAWCAAPLRQSDNVAESRDISPRLTHPHIRSKTNFSRLQK